jgi:hypothetical protein
VTLAHFHLLLNHVPTLGAVLVLSLLVLAFFRRNEHLTHVALEILFVIAVVTLPVYISGVGAHRELRGRPEVSEIIIREHQDAAIYAFTALEFAGFVGWLALWQTRRRGQPSRAIVPTTSVLLVISLAIMGRAANLGGEIRHPEMSLAESARAAGGQAAPALSPDQSPAAAAGAGAPDPYERFLATRISEYMVNSPWAWPAAETVHFLGLSLSIGVLLAVNLRILGAMPRVPFAEVHRLLPWGMLGFGVNLITGMLFFIGQPGQYITSAPFYWKVLFLLIAGANFLYLTVFTKAWASTGMTSSLLDKAMAVSSIVAWLGVLYAGRMLPYLGNAF